MLHYFQTLYDYLNEVKRGQDVILSKVIAQVK